MKEQPPKRKTQYILVPSWVQAAQAVEKITGGEDVILGTGYDYPLRWALFTKDAWSGEGLGYYLWECKNRQLDWLAANITISSDVIRKGRLPFS